MLDIDIIREQDADKYILELKNRIKNGKDTKLEQKKYVIMEDDAYYLSNLYDDPLVRLHIPSHLRMNVFLQYHNDNGHIDTEEKKKLPNISGKIFARFYEGGV